MSRRFVQFHVIGSFLAFTVGLVLFTATAVRDGVVTEADVLGLPGRATSSPSARHGSSATDLYHQGVHGALRHALEAARYGAYQEPSDTTAWYAENPAQRLRARFTDAGVQVQARAGDRGSRSVAMTLRSIGYGERQIAVSAGRLAATGNRVEFRRSGLSDAGVADITEWYVNTAGGLEQGFTIESSPGERRYGEWLRVELALDGELRAQLVDSARALELADEAGQLMIRYDHLVATDARGRKLDARMALGAREHEVWLEVDEREAHWPVTIDPTFTQQQKLEVSDPGLDRFGIELAASAGTVVVGAPFDDGAAGGSQGSVFVFVRSGAGWALQQKLEAPCHTTPSAAR